MLLRNTCAKQYNFQLTSVRRKIHTKSIGQMCVADGCKSNPPVRCSELSCARRLISPNMATTHKERQNVHSGKDPLFGHLHNTKFLLHKCGFRDVMFERSRKARGCKSIVDHQGVKSMSFCEPESVSSTQPEPVAVQAAQSCGYRFKRSSCPCRFSCRHVK